jgi:hypothetical protein
MTRHTESSDSNRLYDLVRKHAELEYADGQVRRKLVRPKRPFATLPIFSV